MKKNLFLCISLFGLKVFAQNNCGTDHMMEIAKQRDASTQSKMDEFNRNAQEFAKSPQNRSAIYTIPVVFHVIHTGGPENISREQILDQIRVLNNDYSFQNWNKNKIRSQFLPRAADCQIRFELAKIDPNGNCTDGVNRIYSPLGVNVSQSTEEFKALSYWNSSKYLNIWVVTSIEAVVSGGTTLGYAYFPWMSPATKNGVVVRSDRVGTIGTGSGSDSGRTCTHEIGHWLGLYHTFEGGCSGSDFCDDTPPVNSAFTNSLCPANGNSCTNDAPDMLDLWEDYMDYSEGTCMAMFTANQKTRMMSSISNYRSSVVSASNLTATGITLSNTAPLANFTASQTLVCAGTPVTFHDISCKAAVTARSWTFTGGSISSSTDPNPVVVYQTPGKYNVTLLVQNTQGSNTKTVTEYIQVLPAKGIYPNIEEGFENGDPASRGYVSTTPVKWAVTNTTAYTGGFSFKAPVNTTDPVGTTYSFVTPAVDLSQLSSTTARITFYCGYAPRVSGESETLRLYMSTDCGSSFSQIYERTGTGLQYVGATATPDFVPSQPSHWRRLGLATLNSFDLPNIKNAIFKMEVISAQGNPVYVDNLNISEWYAGTQTIEKDKMKMRIFPNPASDKVNIELEAASAMSGKAELYDMTGRKVLDIFTGMFTAGVNRLEFSNPGISTGSIFIVKITTPEGLISKAVTFAP